MARDLSGDLDRLIESVYADAVEVDWPVFRDSSLRRLCAWSGASSAAWSMQVRGTRPGEFACWPSTCAIRAAELDALQFAPGHREIEIERAADRTGAHGALALAIDHRGTDLRSVVAVQADSATLDRAALRRALGHLAQATSLALRQFIKRDEWLLDMGRSSRGAAALVDAQGAIYVASDRFRALLELEFGDSKLATLPFALTDERRAASVPFQIGNLHFRVQPQGGLLLINARRPHPLDVLSPREQQIARALALGKTFKSVARDCEIATSTVANHASRIYRKLDISQREELVDLLRHAADATRDASSDSAHDPAACLDSELHDDS